METLDNLEDDSADGDFHQLPQVYRQIFKTVNLFLLRGQTQKKMQIHRATLKPATFK